MRTLIVRALAASVLVSLLAACASHVDFKGTVLPGQAAPNFTLTDQDGKPLELSALRGDEVIMFFGYTHCPDVCPTTLSNLARIYRELGSTADKVKVVFITVDPARDRAPVLQRYVRLFNPAFIGLTGTPATLEPVYKAYHVWAQKLPNKGSAAGYLMAHTSTMFFIDPQGRLRLMHDWSDADGAITYDIRKLLS